jgi:hypothetical protein
MRTMEQAAGWTKRAGLALGASALCVTYACGGGPAGGAVAAQPLAADQAGAPVVVGCEAHQRTLVRQAVVNGALVSQVECVSTAQPVAAHVPAPVAAPPAAYAPAPVAYAPAPVVYAPPAAQAPASRPVSRPVYDDLEDARVVQTASGSARPVQTRQVIYEEPRRTTRSTAKSAVIIGSSAGAGAGVGALVGGKKGALIGAAAGGGGAVVWDQATRRR